MRKHLFSRIMLILLMLNVFKVIASTPSESSDDLTQSVKRGRNYTLGPALDDIPCIVTLELVQQEPFRQQSPLEIKPQVLKNLNQTYDLWTLSVDVNTASLDEDDKKAMVYLKEQREKSVIWRESQNKLETLKSYSSEPLDEGERDALKGARRTDLAVQWLKAQIYELQIVINRVKYLIQLSKQEYKIKSQILENYRQSETDNKSLTYFNINAWYSYVNNYGFSAKLCSVLSDIYGFQFRFDIIDDQSRQAHQKREAFVFEIPKSYTPKTLPRKPENSKAPKIELASCLENNYSQEEYTQFLSEERKTDPEFSITFDEFCAYQQIIQNEKKADESFFMNYSDYEAYLKCISILPELGIRPKDYMLYAAAKKKMKIALSYQDYLDKMGIREELKGHFRKKQPSKEDAINFSSLKQEVLNLLGAYQGENKGFKGGLLGEYLEWHQKVEALDKDLIKFKIIPISLYHLQEVNSSFLGVPSSLTSPYYIISDDFKTWQEIGQIPAPDLVSVEDRLFTKQKKENSSKKQGESTQIFPENFIEKSKIFIQKAYLNFDSKVFLLGLSSEQVAYLYDCLQKDEKATISYMIRGLRSLKIGGKEWVVSLMPISHLAFNIAQGQDLSKIPDIVQRSGPDVAMKHQKRIESYRAQNSEYEARLIKLESEIKQLSQQVSEAMQPQKLKLKTLRKELNSEEISEKILNIVGSPSSSSDVFEAEQQQIVDILSLIFAPQEVQDALNVFLPEEDDFSTVKNEFNEKIVLLKRTLQPRSVSKPVDSEGKKQPNLAIFALNVLDYIPEVLKRIKVLKEKEEERIQTHIQAYDIQSLTYFYAQLQSIPWKQDQRLEVSFDEISDEIQFSQTQESILNFIRLAYQDLYLDILGFKSHNEITMSIKKRHDKGIQIIVNLEDLQIPTVTK